MIKSLYELIKNPDKIKERVKDLEGSLKTAPFFTPTHIYCCYHLNISNSDFIQMFMNYCEKLINDVYPESLREEMVREVIEEAEYMDKNNDVNNISIILRKIKNNSCFLKK